MNRNLKLLKVVVQPVFVLEDEDGDLSELTPVPIVVPAKEWEGFAEGAFAEAVEDLRSRIEAGEEPPAS